MSLDSAIREIRAHEKARRQERLEAELVERVVSYLTGPASVRVAAAKEIIALVREQEQS